MPAAAGNNEKGFFESQALYEFHEGVLGEAGSAWDDLLPMPDSYFSSPLGLARRDQLTELLTRDYAARPLTAVKDPRICRLMPLWREAAAAAGLETMAVLPLRNPLEVAGSLQKRDGFAPAKSLLVWLRHVLSAERESRDMRRVFTTYDGLLGDWPRTVAAVSEALGFAFPREPARMADEITAFLEGELRHNVSPPDLSDRQDVLPEIREAWAALNRLVLGGDAASQAALDGIEARFSEASRLFGGYADWTRRKIQEATHDLRRINGDLARARDHIAHLEEAARERDGLRGQLEAVLQSRSWRITAPVRRITDWTR
jgi:hypothetical protein